MIHYSKGGEKAMEQWIRLEGTVESRQVPRPPHLSKWVGESESGLVKLTKWKAARRSCCSESFNEGANIQLMHLLQSFGEAAT